MSNDAKAGGLALLMLVTLTMGTVVGTWLGGSTGTWTGLLIVGGIWGGVAANSLLGVLFSTERPKRISRQQHRANIETLAARVVMDVEEAV